ncbi:MAG: polysaccharide deacetylase family protein [Candidatus Kerfeldbacteria bacterium]|nr:polysaccharide deacetylase family protein [Candidatus Kerfeldbacteria bacterium]
MADYLRYQPRRGVSSASRWRRIGVWTIGALMIIVLGRALFSGSPSPNANNDNEVSLLSDRANGNTNTNSNTNAAANTNAASGPINPPDVATFSVDRCAGPISQSGTTSAVSLTFNLVATNDQALEVADLLTQQNTAGTFFVSGRVAEQHQDFVANLARAGFGIYNRTYDNPRLTSLTEGEVVDQLAKADQAISAATGRSSKPFLRPPYGDSNESVVATAKSQGYCTILWTVDAFDWQEGMTADQVRKRVVDKAKPGAIIMLSAGFDVTPQAVGLIIRDLKAKGYEFHSLSDLLTS